MSAANPQPLISVVVPIYNSQGIVAELCKRLTPTLSKLCGNDYEIVLVDDCSSDGVWQVIKELAAADGHITGHRLGTNFGQWMAILAGIEQTRGKYIVTIDDDLEYDPAEIEKLYQMITTNDYYLVFGIAPDKYEMKHPNAPGAKLRNTFINVVLQKFVTDSYKIFKREVLFKDNQFFSKVHFEAFVKHTLNERFVGYCEVSYHKRHEGTSNHTMWKKFLIFVRYSIEYYRTPVLGVAFFTYLFFFCSMLVEYFVFNGRLNGVLNTLIGLAILTLALVLLHYISHIYRDVRQIPDYWIVETTKKL